MTSALTVTSREFEMEWALAHRGRCAESITAALRAACVERPGLFSSPLPREQQWTYMNDLKELWLYPPAVATSSGEAKLETKANATEKRTRKCWSTRGSGSSIIKLEGGETSASTPSLAIFLLLPLLFPFHCSAMWRKSDKKLNITIQNSFQMFVLHPSVIFVYLAKLCVLAVKSGGVYKTDTSQGWNCNATLTCFLIRGGEILIYFIFLFLHFFFSRLSPPWVIWRRKRSKSAKHSEHLRWTVYSELQTHTHKKKLQLQSCRSPGGESWMTCQI